VHLLELVIYILMKMHGKHSIKKKYFYISSAPWKESLCFYLVSPSVQEISVVASSDLLSSGSQKLFIDETTGARI
jgi:hypothetical protein